MMVPSPMTAPDNVLALHQATSQKGNRPPMCQTLKPLEDRVIVTDEISTTDSVIEVIDTRPSNQATVISVGPGRMLKNGTRAPMGIKPGDRVMIGRYAGFRYELDSKTVRIIHEADIQGVL